MNPQSQKLLIPSGFDGLLQIGKVIYGARSKDSTCANFEWHAGRASTELEPVASSERHLFSTLALTPGSYWNPGKIVNKIPPIISISQLSARICWHTQLPSTFWKNIRVVHNTTKRLLTSKQTIVLYDKVPIKHGLSSKEPGRKVTCSFRTKEKVVAKRGKLQFKRKRSIIKAKRQLWSCQ